MSDLSTALNKLRKLMTLPDGWNYGEGGKPTRRALRSAALVLQHLNAVDAQRFDILPADNFGVTIMASHGDLVAEININADGSYGIFIERNDVIIADCACPDFGSLVDALEAEGWRSLKSLGSHTRAFTVWSMADSQVPLSKTKAWEHRSFAPIVERRKVGHSAPMWPATTADWAARPTFSSGSQSQPLVTAHG